MSTFLKDFIERETISRRNFLLASAAGITVAALPGSMARAASTIRRWYGATATGPTCIGCRSSLAEKLSRKASARPRRT